MRARRIEADRSWRSRNGRASGRHFNDTGSHPFGQVHWVFLPPFIAKPDKPDAQPKIVYFRLRVRLVGVERRRKTFTRLVRLRTAERKLSSVMCRRSKTL